ncbi:hypothetical protein [Flavobacterium fluviatile]|uniref:hypothetical protein n=1 Tax=Flavobacterium fluviatile TaxID=1862387 RepID=UPI0013CFCFD7|nr:hypothetical protein [Flavobacterium fluviatile]
MRKAIQRSIIFRKLNSGNDQICRMVDLCVTGLTELASQKGAVIFWKDIFRN